MAERRPLVIVNGRRQELPAGDTVAGAGGGSSVPLAIADGVTLTVAANSQVLYDEEIDVDGEIELDGLLTEVD